MAARIFLGLSALIWLPYGIWCLLDPAQLAGSAGVSFVSATGQHGAARHVWRAAGRARRARAGRGAACVCSRVRRCSR